MSERGPLPQWSIIGEYGSGTYEATDPHGVVWRLTRADPTDTAAGYLLHLRDDPAAGTPAHITSDHGLYHAQNLAGLHIARDAVIVDPDNARRQLGLREQ